MKLFVLALLFSCYFVSALVVKRAIVERRAQTIPKEMGSAPTNTQRDEEQSNQMLDHKKSQIFYKFLKINRISNRIENGEKVARLLKVNNFNGIIDDKTAFLMYKNLIKNAIKSGKGPAAISRKVFRLLNLFDPTFFIYS